MREEKEDKEKEEENYYDKSEDDDDDSDDRSHLFEYKDLAGNVQGPFPLTHLEAWYSVGYLSRVIVFRRLRFPLPLRRDDDTIIINNNNNNNNNNDDDDDDIHVNDSLLEFTTLGRVLDARNEKLLNKEEEFKEEEFKEEEEEEKLKEDKQQQPKHETSSLLDERLKNVFGGIIIGGGGGGGGGSIGE